MKSFLLRAGFTAFAFAAPPPGLSATDPPPPPLANASLAPSLEAAARRDGVPLFQLDPTSDDARLGDATVAWIGATDGKTTRQWLIQFRRGTADAPQTHHVTKFLSWGPVVTFKSEVATLDLWIAGPVTISPTPSKPPAIAPVKRARLSVPVDFLRLGLDNAIRVDQHIGRRAEALSKEGANFDFGALYAVDSPLPPEAIASAKAAVDQIGFSPETERVWIGGYLALQTFYTIVTTSPELASIASIAIRKPRLWGLSSALKGTQFKASFGGPATIALDPAERGMLPVPTESFEARYAFFFGEAPITGGSLVVSHAAPPLDTAAGILSLFATHPQNPRRIVQVAIVSAVRGPAPPAAARD